MQEENKKDDYRKVSFKEFLKQSAWVLGYVYRIDKKLTIVFFGAGIINSLRTVINTLIMAKMLDKVISMATTSNIDIRAIYPYLGVMLAYSIFSTIISYVNGMTRGLLRTKFQALSRQTVYKHIQSLGIQTLEDSEVSNKIHRTTMYMNELFGFYRSLQDVVNNIVATIGGLIAVLTFSPVIAAAVVISVIPMILNDKKYRYLIYKHGYDNTEETRLTWNASNDLMSSQALQEITFAGAFNFLDKKFMDFTNWFTGISKNIMKKWNVSGFGYDALSEVVLYAGYVSIITQLVYSKITVGSATFYQRMLADLQGNVTNIFMTINDLMESSLKLKDVYELFQVKPAFLDGTVDLGKLTAGPEISIENLSFSYPKGKKEVIKNLSLTIKSGEKVAIVGHNGAGKTTLVRLILRLYQINNGVIKINGNNLSDLNIASLYKNTGVLMQDYNTYPYLTAEENIHMGDPTRPLDKERIREAAHSADALKFIEEFPNKFNQLLSEKYKKGTRPSTGQWQKIAIARLFYRDPSLVIFDEPTASIDAVSEYNIFNRIYEFFKNKTVIIISHRFSTVRNADRIIVFNEGEIIEQGTHDELMEKDGAYAKAFLLQAEGYNTTTTIAK